AVPGGSLKSKPTWSNASGYFTTSAFFACAASGTTDGPSDQRFRPRRLTTQTMTTEAQNVKFRRQMAKLDASRKTPDKVKMPPREQIRIKRRCKLCGRARAVYRKFGICRICFRDLASSGLIPGVKKASW